MESSSISENKTGASCPINQNFQQKGRSHVTRTVTRELQPSMIEPNIVYPEKCTKTVLVHSGNKGGKRLQKSISKNGTVKKAVPLKQNPSIRSKTRRTWELWSIDDKNSFFEALCEYGKDFESIQSYIAQKTKKRGTPMNMIKNKDQVRHFYYRTWHKISKYLKINDGIRKPTQEIYGLVNYAELRKKIGGGLNEKNGQKLNELVFTGVTTVKYKGKKTKIKTPVCRALKKLNTSAEPKEKEMGKLPKDIVLELRPGTNQAWFQVQDLSQNPRVRTKISLQRHLKAVIEYMQKKWKPSWLKKLGQPSRLLLEYEFENSEEKFQNTKETADCVFFCTTDIMRRLLNTATSVLTDYKNKQVLSFHPLPRFIPRFNNSSPGAKGTARCMGKTSNIRTALRSKAHSSGCSKSVFHSCSASTMNDKDLKTPGPFTSNNYEAISSLNSLCSNSVLSSFDKHVFVVPVGSAPKTMKKPTQQSLREEIDKLLPGTRRGCRVRRKPLVVQRPLLPRDGNRSIPPGRPVTVLHLIPSGSSLTSSIQSASLGENEALLSAKKIVKIVSAGPEIDVRPLQFSHMNPMDSNINENVTLQSTIASNPSTMSCKNFQDIHAENNQNAYFPSNFCADSNACAAVITARNTFGDTSSSNNYMKASNIASQPSSDFIENILSRNGLNGDFENKETSKSSQQCIFSEIPCPFPPSQETISPFIQLSLSDALSSVSKSSLFSNHMCDSTVSSSSSENTPPQSPPSMPLRMQSLEHDGQWLNSDVNPEVSLLDDSNVDFIAKFGDLPDVFSLSDETKQG